MTNWEKNLAEKNCFLLKVFRFCVTAYIFHNKFFLVTVAVNIAQTIALEVWHDGVLNITDVLNYWRIFFIAITSTEHIFYFAIEERKK